MFNLQINLNMKNNEYTSTKVEYTTNINNAINAIKKYSNDPAVNVDKILDLHKILWINSTNKNDYYNYDFKYWYRDLASCDFERMPTLFAILEKIFEHLRQINWQSKQNDAPKYIKNMLKMRLRLLVRQLKWLKMIVRIA